MARLVLGDLTMRYRARKGAGITALEKISFEVRDGEFAVLVGPSGCGKSTILRLVAGLLHPSSGRVRLDDREVTEPGADRGMVFQSYTLFAWLTVQQNVEFGPKIRRVPAEERDRILVMTARPGRIREEIPVPLPRPRSLDVLTSESFVRLKRRVMNLIREEAVKALEIEGEKAR